MSIVAKSAFPASASTQRAASLMGRIGFAARGAIYLLVGASAALAALEPRHKPAGMTDALQGLHAHPLGVPLLLLLAIGLVCLAGWFAIAGWYRTDSSGLKRLALSAAMLGDAVVYGCFVLIVLGLLLGGWSGGERHFQHFAAWALRQSHGRHLVGITGIVVFAIGMGIAGWGIFGNPEKPLALPDEDKRLLAPVRRFGFAGRGIAIALVGAYLIAASWHGNPREAHELGGVLASLRGHAYGTALIGLFALAFIGSGLCDVIEAFYRRFDLQRP